MDSLKEIRSFAWDNKEFLLYRKRGGSPLQVTGSKSSLQRDSLPDLLKFSPKGSRQTRAEFLSTAFNRFLKGEHVYSDVEGNALTFCVWLAENPDKTEMMTSIRKNIEVPENSILLHDLYSRPDLGGHSSFQENLKRVISDVGMDEKMPTVFIMTRANDTAHGRFLEELGFEYQYSLIHSKRLGRKREMACHRKPGIDGKGKPEKSLKKIAVNNLP